MKLDKIPKNCSFWLAKSEPHVFSYSDLVKEKKTTWNGVRNFQARGFLSQMKIGDLIAYYHSGKDKAIVGIARVVCEAYPEPMSKEEKLNTNSARKEAQWVQLDIEPFFAFPVWITLAQIKGDKLFEDFLLVRHSRLSVMPMLKKHFERICELGQLNQDHLKGKVSKK